MSRGSCLVMALLAAFFSSALGQEPDKDQELTRGLEKVMQKAIAQAKPAVACVLVSRSDVYRQLAGKSAGPDSSGILGDFIFGDDSTQEERQVYRRKYDMADPGYVPEAFGSGVVIDPKGLVLTTYHVIRDATKIYIRLPGGKAGYADIHAADSRSDLAVLRLRASRLAPLMAITLGDASKIQPGQFALTVTNPYSPKFNENLPSASWGIISNVRRRPGSQTREEERSKPLYYYGTLLQTDTRLHHGSSGGALLNLQGELIGLTTSLAAIPGDETPGGFSLPLDAGMRRILEVLKRGEEVDYGFLGVQPRSGQGKSVEVNQVTPGSPADIEAHLRNEDVILAVNNEPIHDINDLFLNLGTQLAGTKVTLKILRPKTREINEVNVTLGKFNIAGKKIASSLGKRPFFRGLRVDYTTLLVQPSSPIFLVPSGVLITEVQPGTTASEAKLKAGEVISHVNNRPVSNPENFYQAVADLRGPIELRLFSFNSQEPPVRIVLK